MSAREVSAWDLPTRVFKWTLVALILAAPLTKWYGDVTLFWHRMVGYAILTLIVWRVLWGFFGGQTARLSHIVPSPLATIRYLQAMLKGRAPAYLGHNPLGAWMISALLLVVLTQALTGLFATDDIITDGPLKAFVSHDTSKWLTGIHDRLPQILLGLVILHILANAFHTMAGHPTIEAMVTGRKPALPYADHERNEGGSAVRAMALLAVAAGLVYGGLALFGTSPFA